MYPYLRLTLHSSYTCSNFINSGKHGKYFQVEEMVESLDSTVRIGMENAIQKSKFVGLVADESVDIAVFKKLIVYMQVVVNGRVNLLFLENKNVSDGKAGTITEALLEVLNEWKIPPSKVTGLGSDGAAVMMGARNGVG